MAIAAHIKLLELQIENEGSIERRIPVLTNIVHVQCLLNKHQEALPYAELLYELIVDSRVPVHSISFTSLAEAYCLAGDIPKGEQCLAIAQEICPSNESATSRARLQCGEAILMEARQDYSAAMTLAQKVFDMPNSDVRRADRHTTCNILYRCCITLGRNADAASWKDLVLEIGERSLLGDILTSRIRASLDVNERGEPLTAKELSCLRLSAHDQTSADIAFKLGIKPRSVNYHFSNILRKLNAMNRQEAIVKALTANLLKGR